MKLKNISLKDWENKDVKEYLFGGSKPKYEKGGILNNSNFKSWFGDSKVVDEKGNPLVVYHGTTKDFDTYDKYAKKNTVGGTQRDAFFFSNKPNHASEYAIPSYKYDELEYVDKQYYGSSVMPIYLKINNPLEIDAKGSSWVNIFPEAIDKALDNNKDGVIVYNLIDNATPLGNETTSTTYVVFEPTQIKSAIGNSGEFDSNNPSIIMEKGGKLFDKRKGEFQEIAEEEKTIKNSKQGYNKYLTILKDLKNGLKKDKEIDLMGVFLNIQADIREYDYLLETLTPIIEKNNYTTTDIDNLIPKVEPNLKIYPYTIDELNDVYYKVGRKGLKNSFKQGGILNNPNFKSWFGDSKVVDEKGNPLVVYHGTQLGTKDEMPFSSFKTFANPDFVKFDDIGIWFTESKQTANKYSQRIGSNGVYENGHTYSCYLKIDNPWILEGSSGWDDMVRIFNHKVGTEHLAESVNKPDNIKLFVDYLKDRGKDGIIIKNVDFDSGYSDNEIVDYYIALDPTQIKSAIGNSGEYDPNNPSIIMAEGGQVCTYDFDGYDLAKKKCGNEVDVYLIPAEYKLVSIHLFDNHLPLWLYYNYLARIVISKEDVFTFKKQCLEKFEITNPVRVLVKPYNDKFWKKSYFDEPRSYMSHTAIKGIIQKLEIVLVQDGGWENEFKERTSGLTIPNPKGVHLNTVIHEFAHLIDVLRYNKKNPNEDVIVTHERGFLVALVDVLIACKRNEIPIVNMVDNKALIIQKALQKPSFVERYKDTYGLNVFDGSVPKDLKEYDERFASLKGSKLNKEQAKEMFNLIKKYQDEVLMGMAMINPNKANRLFKSTNDLLTELKKYS